MRIALIQASRIQTVWMMEKIEKPGQRLLQRLGMRIALILRSRNQTVWMIETIEKIDNRMKETWP